MNHDPAEKNLKHRTDVLLWDEVDWSACELNFRAPAAEKLAMSPARAMAQLLLASGAGAVGGVIFMIQAAPLLHSRSWIEAVLVAAVMAALIGSGFYRPLPRVVPEQENVRVALLGAASVMLFFVAIRFSCFQNVFASGVLLTLSLAVPWVLFLADQMTAHMIHWISADPRIDRDEMVIWRNAWCGRFMTVETEKLRASGVSPTLLAKLQQYRLGHFRVGVVCAASVLVGIVAASTLQYERAGVVIVGMLTASLAMLAAWTYGVTAGGAKTFPETLGHWFEYQKDQRQPPWSLQSPGGVQLARSFLAYGAAGAMAFGLLLLGLADASWGSRTLADVTQASKDKVWPIGIGAIIVTAINVLLVCFIVSAPTTAAFHAAIEEICDVDQ